MFNSFQVHKEPQLSCLVLCTVFDMFVAWCHTKARSSFCLGKNMRFLIFLVIFWQTSGWNILFEFLIDDLDQSKSKSNNYLFFVLPIYNFQNNFHIYHTLREFGIRKLLKKLVISLLFCKFIVENQQLIKQI